MAYWLLMANIFTHCDIIGPSAFHGHDDDDDEELSPFHRSYVVSSVFQSSCVQLPIRCQGHERDQPVLSATIEHIASPSIRLPMRSARHRPWLGTIKQTSLPSISDTNPVVALARRSPFARCVCLHNPIKASFTCRPSK